MPESAPPATDSLVGLCKVDTHRQNSAVHSWLPHVRDHHRGAMNDSQRPYIQAHLPRLPRPLQGDKTRAQAANTAFCAPLRRSDVERCLPRQTQFLLLTNHVTEPSATLEAESLHISADRRANRTPGAAVFDWQGQPVLLHLARKAFAPAPLPFLCCTSTPAGSSAR